MAWIGLEAVKWYKIEIQKALSYMSVFIQQDFSLRSFLVWG